MMVASHRGGSDGSDGRDGCKFTSVRTNEVVISIHSLPNADTLRIVFVSPLFVI
jgi:hypothetical protein